MGKTYWEKLVEEHGEEKAREIAREHTAQRKSPGGFAVMSKAERVRIASLGGKAAQAKIKALREKEAASNGQE